MAVLIATNLRKEIAGTTLFALKTLLPSVLMGDRISCPGAPRHSVPAGWYCTV